MTTLHDVIWLSQDCFCNNHASNVHVFQGWHNLGTTLWQGCDSTGLHVHVHDM